VPLGAKLDTAGSYAIIEFILLIRKGDKKMKKIVIGVMLALTLIAAPVMAKEGFFIGASLIPSVDITGDFGSHFDGGSGYSFRAGFRSRVSWKEHH
jgi:hypothetical protein